MGLADYDLSPEGLRGVKTKVEGEADDLPGKRNNLSDSLDACVTASKMPQVATALTGFWNGLLAIQAEAAETRIGNACTALGDVATAYLNGDGQMMDDAQAAAVAVPGLEIDDAKVVR